MISFRLWSINNRIPFKKDVVRENAKLHVFASSDGSCIYSSNTSSDDYIEYSSKWRINSDGMYERDLICYDINGDISDIDVVMKMSKEELESVFKVKERKTIVKSSLTVSDEIYNEDVIVISDNYFSNGIVEREDKNSFIYQKVLDEMRFPLYNLGYSKKNIDKRINKVLLDFNMDSIKDKNINDLNYYEKEKLLIMISCIKSLTVILKGLLL